MARIRTIKPEIASHEELFDLEQETGLPIRFAWCMLFTVADREGRFTWRPRTLKAQILPHDEIDFSRVLDAWATRGFIVKYRVGNACFGWIPTFTKHQVINNREAKSDLPSIDEADEVFSIENNDIDACRTRDPRDDDASATREVHALGEGRKEGREQRVKHASQQADEESTKNVHAVFEHWQKTWKHPNAKLDAKRTAKIKARLKEGFTTEQLNDAITGFTHSAWHTGTDPKGNGTVYDGIETLLRDAAQVEKGIRLLREHSDKGREPSQEPMRHADGREVRW